MYTVQFILSVCIGKGAIWMDRLMQYACSFLINVRRFCDFAPIINDFKKIIILRNAQCVMEIYCF